MDLQWQEIYELYKTQLFICGYLLLTLILVYIKFKDVSNIIFAQRILLSTHITNNESETLRDSNGIRKST